MGMKMILIFLFSANAFCHHYREVLNVFSGWTSMGYSMTELQKNLKIYDSDDTLLILNIILERPDAMRPAYAMALHESLMDLFVKYKSDESRRVIVEIIEHYFESKPSLARQFCDVLIKSYGWEAVPNIIKYLFLESGVNVMDAAVTDYQDPNCPPPPFYCDDRVKSFEIFSTYIIKNLESLIKVEYPKSVKSKEDKQIFWAKWYLEGGFDKFKEMMLANEKN